MDTRIEKDIGGGRKGEEVGMDRGGGTEKGREEGREGGRDWREGGYEG